MFQSVNDLLQEEDKSLFFNVMMCDYHTCSGYSQEEDKTLLIKGMVCGIIISTIVAPED